MERQMLRYLIEELKARGKLMVQDSAVDAEYEMGNLLKQYSNKVPMLFNNIKGYRMRSIGGLFGSRELIYELQGYTKGNRIDRLIEAVVNPKDYSVVRDGPVCQNNISGNIDIMRDFPVNRFQEKDSAAFITAGAVVYRDPETGFFNTSVRRMQVNGGNQLSILIASEKMMNDFLEAEKLDRPIEVAVILGYDIPFLLSSQYSSKLYGVDSYRLDSSLRGEPLELVRCKTVDLLVPAHCEIVMEGFMEPNRREYEGPFGELMGYYGSRALQPIVTIKHVMHRSEPIYQTAFPCREEHLTNGMIREIEIYSNLKNVVNVVDVYVTEGGGYRFNAVVKIKKTDDTDARMAIITALGTHRDLKQVVVVDEDVDIYDRDEIEWATATRCQAGRDIIIIPGSPGSGLDPSFLINGASDKLGIDATKPLGEMNENFNRAIIPVV